VTLPAGHVLLVGFMGSGKSSVGLLLAQRLGVAFVDLDDRIAQEAGVPIPTIFAEEGERGFRDRESRALSALALEPPAVVACGGGIVSRAENRRALRDLGTVVYLRVSAGESARRCGAGEGRPMLSERSAHEVAELLEEREPYYVAVADVQLDTDGRMPETVAGLVEAALTDGERSSASPPETDRLDMKENE
jgi:shikimate kinase